MEPLTLTAEGIAAAAGGRVIAGDGRTEVERVSIDSRTVAGGELFIAIRGERFDGHRFVADALARGAIGALIDDPRVRLTPDTTKDGPEPEPAASGEHRAPVPVLIQVEDTTRALQSVARDVRRRSGAQVVAITGSAGKTTTKEATADFLAARYRVFRNRGNLNNHIGLPLSLLELRSRPEIAVVELGMNHPGEISTLVGIAEPDVRVWTNVGDAHLGFFESADAMADAKAEILQGACPDQILVANANDPRVMARARGFSGRVVTFGIETSADVRATGVELLGLAGTAALVRTPVGQARLRTSLLGIGNLANILAALTTALQFHIPLDRIAERAGVLGAAHHRGEVLRLPGGVTLVDDSYNSSPAALRQALDVVRAATGSARKVAILGEMLELGRHTERLHTECGQAAAAAGLDFLIAVGGIPARVLADAATRAGLPPSAVTHVGTASEAAHVALGRVRPGDLVLVKGSRGIGTDVVVARLKEEFA